MKILQVTSEKISSSFNQFEQKYSLAIPNELKTILTIYGGNRTKERIYLRRTGIFDVISQFLNLNKEGEASVEKIYEGHLFYGIVGFIPFGIDSGGWDYNYSTNEETFGQVWVNKFDSGDEDTLEFVCSSFEKFIDGLITEEEAIKLGY